MQDEANPLNTNPAAQDSGAVQPAPSVDPPASAAEQPLGAPTNDVSAGVPGVSGPTVPSADTPVEAAAPAPEESASPAVPPAAEEPAAPVDNSAENQAL